jgi:type II secretory pathway pseudopilin PulG
MAISVMILGLLTVGVVGLLTRQIEQRRIAETRTQLERARDALLAFVTINGRLPCPALPTSAGHEVATAVSNPTTGAETIGCGREWGLLPAVTLGLADLSAGGWLMNGWGDDNAVQAAAPARALRYGVSALSASEARALTSPRLGAGSNDAITRRQQVRDRLVVGHDGWFVCASLTGATGAAGATRCGTDANTLAKSVAAAVWSSGANGHFNGGTWSADEIQNESMTLPRVTISRTLAPTGAVGGGFDDQVTWLPFSLIAERLVVTGLLP